jgi:hypothetical protein
MTSTNRRGNWDVTVSRNTTNDPITDEGFVAFELLNSGGSEDFYLGYNAA